MTKTRYSKISITPAFLFLSSLACRPVMTIGWQEIGILALLLVVLLGPALFKLYKRLDEFQHWKSQKDKNKPED